MDSLEQSAKKVSPLSEEEKNLATPASNAKDSADEEAVSINNEDLDRKAAQNEHEREQSFKNHFELLMIGALWVIGAAIFAVFLIFILHMIFPICRCWLSEEQLKNVQAFLFGSFGGAAVTTASRHVHKRTHESA